MFLSVNAKSIFLDSGRVLHGASASSIKLVVIIHNMFIFCRIVLANEKGVALVDIDLEGKKDADVENTVVNMGDVIVPTSVVTHSVPEDDPVITASVTHDVPIMAPGVSEITWKNIIINSPVQFGSISDFLKQDM